MQYNKEHRQNSTTRQWRFNAGSASSNYSKTVFLMTVAGLSEPQPEEQASAAKSSSAKIPFTWATVCGHLTKVTDDFRASIRLIIFGDIITQLRGCVNRLYQFMSQFMKRCVLQMKTSDFFYDLPEELIAQSPLENRSTSRLLCLSRKNGELAHKTFSDLPELLNPGDLLVMNNSRVIPARLIGNKVPTGAAIQFLLLEQKDSDTWEVLTKPGRKALPGAVLSFGGGRLIAEILEVIEGGVRVARFSWQGDFHALLDEIGEIPLPEYIHETPQDLERYQTVYSKERGSAAAPTAGLHFTPELLAELEARGIDHAFLTLHVGLGTFRPVKADNIEEHHMHRESYQLSEETAEKIRKTKANGGRVIAVGTTACRTLESIARDYGEIKACSDSTDIFIYPGREFRAIDGLITNFHLPQSTLIMLVSAFAGYESTMAAYHEAVREKYRFFSFGDAMLIV